MPITNINQSFPRQRNAFEFSFTPAEERRRDLLIRAAYMKIVEGFVCRPIPRSHWDETNTGDVTSWNKLLPPIRQAMVQAALSGNPQLIAQTRDGVRAFARELEADFLSLLPSEEEESALATALHETKYEGPANEVEALFIANPSPTNAERAIVPMEKQFKHLGNLIEKCRHLARSRTAPMVSVTHTERQAAWQR